MAGVANSLPADWLTFRREVASRVGGGVCICEVSILTGRDRTDGFSLKMAPVLPAAELGLGEDDNLQEGSTGGSGRLVETRWLT